MTERSTIGSWNYGVDRLFASPNSDVEGQRSAMRKVMSESDYETDLLLKDYDLPDDHPDFFQFTSKKSLNEV